MRISIAFSFLFFAFVTAAQPAMPALTKAGLIELNAFAKQTTNPRELTEATQGSFPTALIHGRCMVGFLGKTNGDFTVPSSEHFVFGARKGNVVSFRLDAYHLDELNRLTGLTYTELAGKAVPHLDKAVKAARADSVHMGFELPQNYLGRDVLIGVTDWGFDYTHPMFYDTSLTETRILRAWDQYKQSGPEPNGFTYGTEYSTPSALLSAQSDTANIYSYATHGTHVAGIAGGGGAGLDLRGFAPAARFLFNTFLVDAAAVFDAFAWMQQVAEQEQQRLVINMSWGLYHFGTLDGQSLLSQVIEDMSEEGVVFVTSGGNNGNVNFHIKKTFNQDTLRTRVQFFPYSAHPKMWGQSLSMWGEAGKSFHAKFEVLSGTTNVLAQTPWYFSQTQQSYLDSVLVIGSDTVFFNLTSEAAHPLNGKPFFRLRVKNTHTQYNILLKAWAEDGTVHFHNVTELTNDVGNWGQPFLAGAAGWTAGDALYGIGEPAATEAAISVAAYTAESLSPGGTAIGGQLANFSSSGPTLDDRVKPDIAAPGVSVASAVSLFTDANYTQTSSVEFNGQTYPFAKFSGTSMSGPAVAGIVALILEADPTLTPADIREILKATARTDNHTGIIPEGGHLRWGMGKVNAYRAVREALGLNAIGVNSQPGFAIWPNPANQSVRIHLEEMTAGQVLMVLDLAGRIIHAETITASRVIELNVSGFSEGMYLISLRHETSVRTGKLLIQR